MEWHCKNRMWTAYPGLDCAFTYQSSLRHRCHAGASDSPSRPAARIASRNSDEHSIPLPFLTQILQQLRAANLVCSTRGAFGGYRLCNDPSKITVADIVQAVCPFATTSPSHSTKVKSHQAIAAIWEALDASIQKQLTVYC